MPEHVKPSEEKQLDKAGLLSEMDSIRKAFENDELDEEEAYEEALGVLFWYIWDEEIEQAFYSTFE